LGGRPLALGIVGCGDVAAHYGEAIGSYPELRVAAAFDRHPSRAAQFVASFGGRTVISLEEMLEDPEVDVVVISPGSAPISS
jgi:predicted dehydrogenase